MPLLASFPRGLDATEKISNRLHKSDRPLPPAAAAGGRPAERATPIEISPP